MDPEEAADPRRLVPLAEDLRSMARGCVLGSAAALLVVAVGKGGRRDWSRGHVGMQLLVLCFVTALSAVQLYLPKRRASRRARGTSAVPLPGPGGPRPGTDEVRRLLKGDGAVMAMAGALAVFVAAELYDVPLLGAGVTGVLVPLMLVTDRPGRAWERERGVVLWRPALGSRPYSSSPLYSTPARPAADGG